MTHSRITATCFRLRDGHPLSLWPCGEDCCGLVLCQRKVCSRLCSSLAALILHSLPTPQVSHVMTLVFDLFNSCCWTSISYTYPSHCNPRVYDFMSEPRTQPSLFPSSQDPALSASWVWSWDVLVITACGSLLYTPWPVTPLLSACVLAFYLSSCFWSAHPSDLLHCLLSWGGSECSSTFCVLLHFPLGEHQVQCMSSAGMWLDEKGVPKLKLSVGEGREEGGAGQGWSRRGTDWSCEELLGLEIVFPINMVMFISEACTR